MQTPQEKLRSFLDPENRISDKSYAKLLSDISAPPKKPHHNNINCALLEFAKQMGISYEGVKPIDGVQFHMFQAPKGVSWEDIDTLREVMTNLDIKTCIQHEKRPLAHYRTQPEMWTPPAGMERGIIPNADIAYRGRGMSRSATDEMLMQLEDDQMQFGLEALNKYLEQGVRPGVLTGRVSCAEENPSVVATAWPSDLEERRSAFASQEDRAFHQRQLAQMQSGVKIKTVHSMHETKSGADVFQVICDETNNPPDVVATGDLNVDILFNMNHVSAKLSDMGISWQGGSSQKIDSAYASGYAKHILQLRDDHGVEPEPVTLIDGKLVAGDTKKQNHARVIDLFRYAADVGLGDFSGQRPPYESNIPKGSQIVMAYDVSIYKDTSVKTVMRKDADGNMHVLSTHTISALDVARITDKQNRQMQHAETAEFLTEMRKESGSTATISPAYVAALNAQDARKKQKKVKTKNRNKRAKR